MTIEEKNNIINNFENYIKNKKQTFFLEKIFTDIEFCNFIISNKLFWKNIDILLIRTGTDSVMNCIKLLAKIDKTGQFLNEDVSFFVDSVCFEYSNYKMFLNFLTYSKLFNNEKINKIIFNALTSCSNINSDFIKALLDCEYCDIVRENINNILNNSNDLIGLKEVFKNNDDLSDKVCNYIDKNIYKIIQEILIKGFQSEYENIQEILEKEKITLMMKYILDEILEYEKLKYSDISFLGAGEYSQVFQIGPRVLKVGRKRETFVIDNNKRFLKPLFRTEITVENDVLGCIEIVDKVDTLNIPEEAVQMVYNELRDAGYRWCDCRADNLGRLIKKNSVNFKDINPVMRSVGYNNACDEVLIPGDLVIIDNDYIFKEEDFEKLEPSFKDNLLFASKEYEERYQKSKNKGGVK